MSKWHIYKRSFLWCPFQLSSLQYELHHERKIWVSQTLFEQRKSSSFCSLTIHSRGRSSKNLSGNNHYPYNRRFRQTGILIIKNVLLQEMRKEIRSFYFTSKRIQIVPFLSGFIIFIIWKKWALFREHWIIKSVWILKLLLNKNYYYYKTETDCLLLETVLAALLSINRDEFI